MEEKFWIKIIRNRQQAFEDQTKFKLPDSKNIPESVYKAYLAKCIEEQKNELSSRDILC